MYQRFVITILIARAELQVRTQEQPHVIFPLGQHDALVARVAREDDLVSVEIVIRRLRNLLRGSHSRAEQHEHGNAGGPQH